jgi:Leucine-rich repeat (LRR) protein
MNISIKKGIVGKKIVCTGSWDDSIITYMQEENITELELNAAKGWTGKNISFLPELSSFLTAFTIIGSQIDDVKEVNSLDNLTYLNIQTYHDTEIDFTQFPKLEVCSIFWNQKLESIGKCTTLRDLFVYKFKGSDFSLFSKLKKLERLRIKGAQIDSLMGVDSLKNLKKLEMYLLTKLTSLSGIESSNNLEMLVIDTCKKIENIKEVSELKKLKVLAINNCGEIESLAPLVELKKLQQVLFWESTNIKDGDLSILKRLPSLEKVAYQNRRHYSHKREEILEE